MKNEDKRKQTQHEEHSARRHRTKDLRAKKNIYCTHKWCIPVIVILTSIGAEHKNRKVAPISISLEGANKLVIITFTFIDLIHRAAGNKKTLA